MYRKLNANEIAKILADAGYKPESNSRTMRLRDYVKKYYPPSAAAVHIQYHSEYNDSDYDYSIQYLGVYDKSQNELLPLKATAREARALWADLPLKTSGYATGMQEDEIIPLNGGLPELYVKED